MTFATACSVLAGTALVAAAVVAIAGLVVAPDADLRAAYAQSEPTVTIGGLMSNVSADEFPDDYRRLVLSHAVDAFNIQYSDLNMTLEMTNYTRTDKNEHVKLLEAYDDGSGPKFYVGPTTSQGLANILANSSSKALLDNDKVLLVSPSSEAPSYARADDNIFRLAFNAVRQGDILVDEVKSANITSYVVVARNDAWGQQLAVAVNEKADQEGLVAKGQTVFFDDNRSSAYWSGIRSDVESRVGTVQDGSKVGVFFLGYDHHYHDMANVANSSMQLRDSTAWFIPSATDIDTMSRIGNDTVRSFSTAVGLTALDQDTASNSVTETINGLNRGQAATFYEHSTYDSVFVLGNAIRMAMSVENANDVATVEKYMAAAAMNYTGAALGDSLLLDVNGDLRAPDKFTVYKVNMTEDWVKGGSSSSTVTRIGALVALNSTDYPDNKPWEAMREAAADYNAGDRESLVKLITYNITDPSDPSGYVARAVLERAYADGDGPTVYVGPSLSSNVRAVYDYVQDNDILLLGYASEAESLSTPNDNLFRTAITTARQGHFMAQVMADAGVKSVVTVIRNDAWGQSLNSSIAEALAANGLSSAGVVTFTQSSAASAVGDIAAAIAGSSDVGVAFVATKSEQDALAAAAPSNATLTTVPWFVTPTGYYTNMTEATRDFAKAVNMTAIVLDVEDNAKKSALDAKVQGLDFYGYSAYDGLSVLGNAIASVVESGKTSGINATDLNARIPLAAEAYDGALGNIALNTNGDLRSPDRFAVWKVNNSGMWADTGVTKQTPVVNIGALMATDSTDYADNKAWEALRQAAVDYNGADERDYYLNPILYDITNQSDPGKYVAASVLESAYDGGDGPTVYVGPSLSSNVEAVLPYATANDIVLLGYASESESLAVADDNLFRTAISTARHGHFMAQVMADAGVSSVITVIRDDAWGRSSNSSIAEALAPNGLRSVDVVTFDPGSAASAVGDIATAIAGATGVGVALVATESEQNALAAAAAGNAALTSVPWFVTPSGYYTNMDATTRDFAKAVNMTAIVLDVEDNAKKSALDAKVQGLDFYDYSAYDALSVLGNAIAPVVESGKTSGINATDLNARIPLAAEAYVGVLGNIALNTNGDLRSPDRFAVWKVDSTTGNWMDTGVTKQTPIVEIGALMAIDSTDYADNKAWDALRQAAVDYNGADERDYYLNPILYDITRPSDSGAYDARMVIERAYAGGDGPSVYVGPSLSSNIEAVLGYAAANNITLLGFASEAESLAIADDNLFRTAISTARHGHFMAQVMADAGVRSVVTVIRDDAWGRSMNGSIAEALAPNGLRPAGVVTFTPGNAGSAIEDISAAITKSARAGVALVGVKADQDALAAAASGNATLTGVPWFVTPSGYDTSMNPTTREFAKAVNMRAIVLDVGDNTKKSALDARVQGLDFYSYSAYDALFVIGNAIAAAPTANKNMIGSDELQDAIPGAADAYEGVLGDIALNSKGDLRSPDRFAVWQVDSSSGMWTDTKVRKQTPVVDIGAITIREGDRFDDAPRFEAMRIAVNEYNRDAEDGGTLYLNLREVETSLSPSSARDGAPDALTAIMAASGGANDMKYFVGPSTSGNSGRVLEFANENNLTLISPSSTAPSLAIDNDALFRLVPNDAKQGKVISDIIHNHQSQILANLINETGHEHVIMVVRNDTWGQGLNGSASERLNVHDVDITRVFHNEADADWSKTAMDINTTIARVRDNAPGDPIAVLHIGFPGDFLSLAAQADNYPPIRSVSWFGTDGVAGAAQLIDNDTARQFADDVNLTATKFDVVANAKLDALTAALQSRNVQVRTVYEYSAYDSVFVMARAIESAISTKGASSYTPSDVREMVRAAASEYEGALGDIELNTAGDLRSPNSYAAWEVRNGTWTKIETHPSTPVFDVGALLMLDNNLIYTDDRELAAMRVAVDDFNTEHELIGDFYISLAIQRIKISPTDDVSPDPEALEGLQNAYAGGDGPSYYVGPSTSGNTGRVLKFANDNGIALISHSSTAPSLAVPDDNLFRMVVPDSLQGIVLGDLISMESSVSDLVMVIRNDTWGRGVHEKTAERMGDSTAVTRVYFGEAERDWASIAASLDKKIADATTSAAAKDNGRAAVLFIGFDGDFIAMSGQGASFSRLDSVTWFGPDGIGNSPTVIANSTAVDFAKSVGMTTVIYSVAANSINERLDPMAVYGPSAYDAVYVMGNAIKAAYSEPASGMMPMPPTGEAVVAAIPDVARAYSGALGNVTFDASGDLASPATYAIYRIGADDVWMQVRVVDAGAGAMCEVSLSRPDTIPLGTINIGGTSLVSAPMSQSVMSTGAVPFDTITIEAMPWKTGANVTVLGAGATEVATSANNPTWAKLSTPFTIAEPSSPTQVVMFRLDATGADTTRTVDIEQIVTYTVTCSGS